MLLTFTDILVVYLASLVLLFGSCCCCYCFFFGGVCFFVCLFCFVFLPVEVICQLPRRLLHLSFFFGQSKEFEHPSFPATCCYSASTAVRGARLCSRSRVNCCGNLQLSRFAVSCNYRAVLEMMVKVKCKLTGIEVKLSSYGRCAPYCRF